MLWRCWLANVKTNTWFSIPLNGFYSKNTERHEAINCFLGKIMFSGFILIHFPGAICLLVVCPATPLKIWEVHSTSSYITCTSCPSSFGYLSKITEFYFDFQDSCCIYISVFLVSWKTHHISSQRGRKVISQERGSWWGGWRGRRDLWLLVSFCMIHRHINTAVFCGFFCHCCCF